MKHREQRELFQAVLAVAGADGTITRAERGLVEALAGRVGVGRFSLDAMIERATRDAEFKRSLGRQRVGDPVKAMELLVAAARIDGEISEEERQLLLHIAVLWDVPNDEFAEAFRRGLATADRKRAERRRR